MAWGYWSATSVSDRGRSPRRGGGISSGGSGVVSAGGGGGGGVGGGPSTSSSNKEFQQQQPNVFQSSSSSSSTKNNMDELQQIQLLTAAQDQQEQQQQQQQTYATIMTSSNSGGASTSGTHLQVTLTNSSTSQSSSGGGNEFEEILENHQQLFRRPSLDLNSLLGGPQTALAGILCQAHASSSGTSGGGGGGGGSSGSGNLSKHGGTLSAGNTLTRLGSRHTAVEYAVPHHHFHHYSHHPPPPLLPPPHQQQQQQLQTGGHSHSGHPYLDYRGSGGSSIGGGSGCGGGSGSGGGGGGGGGGGRSVLSISDDDSSSEPGYDCIRTEHLGEAAMIYGNQPAYCTFDLYLYQTYSAVFPTTPPPTTECETEDRSIYRRGARRWRKLYRTNGHIFQAKRFNRRAFCAYCHDRIWGLGRQGFKCIQCKLLVHKKCHKVVNVPCIQNEHQIESNSTRASTRATSSTSTTIGETSTASQQLITTCNNDHDIDREREFLDSSPPPPPPPDITRNNFYLRTNEQLINNTLVDDYDINSQRQYSLNDFNLIRVIGRGSYAKVLMVELKKTKRLYAMKVIKKALVTDDEDIDWVQTEKHVFETASNHPFLVGLHSCFQTPSRLFFVIEFVRGGDLMFHMQRQRKLPEDHARFYAAEIAIALNFLHSKGIIYRDLKLDNVLLDHEGHIKLTDYGMCKEGIRLGDTTSTFCGTPNYIAPEILRGEDYGFSVDWWALGVLLYEMLAGRSPFDIAGASENPEQNTEDYLFQVILEKTIRIPRSLSVKATNVLKGFLTKNPADRLGCQSTDSFIDIVNHQFFKCIDWELLEQKQITPPYKPRLDSDKDLANFPPEFTDEPVHLTPDDPRIIEKIDQSEFEGFEYVNPLLMSLEDCV